MVWFIDDLDLIGSYTNVFSTVDILLVLVVSTILCFIAAITYKNTHDGVSYSASFTQTTVIFGVIVSMIMLIIGSNIARAFTLVGALSIIRFRNAIKETRDVGFIFFMMAIGMAVGTRFFGLAVIMTLFVCLLIIGMYIFDFASQKEAEEMLKITTAYKINYELEIKEVFSRYLQHYKLLTVDQTESNIIELIYLIRFKKNTDRSSFVQDLKKINSDNQVSIFGTDHLAY